MKNELKSTPSLWKHRNDDRAEAGILLPCGLLLYTYRICNASLSGTRLLFMTDFHVRWGETCCYPSGVSWGGADWIGKSVSEASEYVKPDIFIFGGDLASESCMLPASFAMLDASVPEGVVRVSVAGNWDRRRKRWLPDSYWEESYGRIGFHYLVNKFFLTHGIMFYGMDDFKLGKSFCPPLADTDLFRCFLIHNPDGVTEALDEDSLRRIDLILCGHTHGGQFRVPFFGAVKTSSRHWKSFERGLYVSESTDTRMLVSAGLGATWLPYRLNCPPEAYAIEFVGGD